MSVTLSILENICECGAFRLVDSSHPVNLYVGKDEMARPTLLMICTQKPKTVSSSQMIIAEVRQRDDGKWSVSFSLENNEYKDLFVLFCDDIIASSQRIHDKDRAAAFVITRYESWKTMLANAKSDLLTSEEIKGLLGEMYFLKNVLMKKYSPEESALSWTGPRMAHQDFIIYDTWYEVKTVSSGRENVKISSIEQLDSPQIGHLVVVFADKTSSTNENAVTLNSLYSDLLTNIKDEDVKEEFSNMLLKYGYYPRSEYESVDYVFEVKGIQRYLVSHMFPSLRKNSMPASIARAEYYLSLAAIQKYKEDNHNGIE